MKRGCVLKLAGVQIGQPKSVKRQGICDLRLVHYARHSLKCLYNVQQQLDGSFLCPYKPKGLWISAEGDGCYGWKDWCQDESFGCLDTATAINIVKPGAILHLQSAAELREFSLNYLIINNGYHVAGINWPQVAERYSGIIIAPYQYSCRLILDWYYTWDCSSGCIWDVSCIEIGGNPNDDDH